MQSPGNQPTASPQASPQLSATVPPSASIPALQLLQDPSVQQALHQYVTSQVQAQVAAIRAQHTQRPKIPQPEKFTGKRPGDLDRFLLEMDKAIRYHGMEATQTSQETVDWVAQYLCEDADVWRASLSREQVTGADGVTLVTPRSLITSWPQFQVKLRERFRPLPVSFAARAALDRVRQSTSVLRYNHEFTTLLAQIEDMSNSDKVHAYLRGLKDQVRRDVYRKQPQTLNDAMTWANLEDSLYMSSVTRSDHLAGSSRSSFQAASQQPRAASSNPGAAPMDLSHMATEEPAVENDATLAAIPTATLPKLTEAEREKLKKAGLCFRCRVGRHMAKDCPKAASSIPKSKN